jgi:sucrose phosphorylase
MIGQLKKLFEDFYPHENFTVLKSKLQKIQKKSGTIKDPILLTYPDSVENLYHLNFLLSGKNILNYFNSVHILPMFESNADGGFAASSYVKINANFGSWSDLQEISKKYSLIIDAIFNHTSDEHIWFKKFLETDPHYKKFYIEYNTKFDYSQIIRPRTSSLFTKIKNKKVLTTFSSKQIDLNIQDVNVFYELIDVLSFYINNNISGLRLDAIPYIIKKTHTSCANLDDTYKFTKLLIQSINYMNTKISVICEANFSDKENFNYLKKSNADYIYQFSFSHLLFYCLYYNDFSYFVSWFKKTKSVHKQSLFYISNHDGYALSGIRRILNEKEFQDYISLLKNNKFKINYRQNQQTNIKEPYEVNTTFYSYLKQLDVEFVYERYILLLHILCQMEGKILLYYLDLVGEENDIEAYKKTKENRSLHRKKYSLEEYNKRLQKSKIYEKIQEFLKERKKTKSMETKISFKNPLLIIKKLNSKKYIISYYNISNKIQKIEKEQIQLKPYEFISITKNI